MDFALILAAKLEPKQEVYGYVYDQKNRHNGKIRMLAEQVPAFLMQYHEAPKVEIINLFDLRLVTFSGGFIQYCSDQRYLAEHILPVLVPMQQGKAEIVPFTPLPTDREEAEAEANLCLDCGLAPAVKDGHCANCW